MTIMTASVDRIPPAFRRLPGKRPPGSAGPAPSAWYRRGTKRLQAADPALAQWRRDHGLVRLREFVLDYRIVALVSETAAADPLWVGPIMLWRDKAGAAVLAGQPALTFDQVLAAAPRIAAQMGCLVNVRARLNWMSPDDAPTLILPRGGPMFDPSVADRRRRKPRPPTPRFTLAPHRPEKLDWLDRG